MKELTHCPKCKFDLRGEDIYQHFFDRYQKDGIPEYFRGFKEIKEGIANYPSLYKNAPSLKELAEMSTLELAAWDSANSYGWTKEKPRTFRKEIGIEIQGYWDGVVVWRCPKCSHKWKRFEWVKDEYLK